MADLVTITVDGVAMQGKAGEVLIKVAEDNGNFIPRFCWHPRMKPVGMCRMCLVEVVGPRGRMLVPSCTTTINEGMEVDTQSAVVKKAQEGVLEYLLINHPLDCPVCDKGGECPLQDHTVAYGPGESRFVEEKRHFEKPIPISELVLLDRERCILCARCTRFSDEISGDPLIEFKDRGNAVQVITFPGEPFSSYFSGNTVQICPVGALTAKPYRFKARPWDLEAVESVSMVDSIGSKVSVQSSQNEVVRIDGIDNDATNHGWLSDKDRFVFESIHSADRITTPLIKEEGQFREATWGEALDLVAERLTSFPGAQVAGLGGANSTNEEAYTFGKFLRTIVVTPHIDAQLDDGLDPQFLVGVTPRAAIPDLETAKTILLWAADLKEEYPVLYLRVRRAAAELGANLIVVHPRATGLDDVATHKVRYRPGTGPEVLRELTGDDADYTEIREALAAGPVVGIVGRTGLGEDPRLAEAVAAFVRDFSEGKIMPLARRGNVVGALDMGLAPTLLPGRVSESAAHDVLESEWGPLPEGLGRNATSILEGLRDGELRALIMLGTDPVRDHAEPELAAAGLDGAEFVVAMDQFITDSVAAADVVFPVAGFAEVEGTVTNIEGRVQKVNRLVPSPGQTRATWSVLDDLARRMDGNLGATAAAAIAKEITGVAPAYHGVTWDALDWGDGREGLLLPLAEGVQHLEYIPVDGQLASVDARYGLHLGRVLYDDGVRVRMSPSLAALRPEGAVFLNAAALDALGLAPGSPAVVEGASGRVELPVAVDNSLGDGTVYVPANLESTRSLGAAVAVTVSPGGDA
ncbi:MAG: NADH-quinone oxidoreductase subunit NuoG [Acidimicrobiia bacterium]|nr:NADH-quinone oxidoreductase subunit NuoG [Acidimicrobiia bacterium]